MNLVVHIPDEFASRVSGIDPARLRAALEAVLRTAEESAPDEQRAMAVIVSEFSPQEAAARMRAARPGNKLPPDVTIRDLMTHALVLR